jgi:peroxiredoxin (alkyl hydroperoxide reductase subunit C)
MALLVQRPFPDFTCAAVMPDGSIEDAFRLGQYLDGHIGVLVFYPLDFTFVCPTELIALDHRVEAFHQRGVRVAAVSIDSQFTHAAWRSTPVERGGIGPVRYPMLADTKHEICRSYGVQADDGVALRATFVIDKQGIVRAQHVNDLPIGRSMDEALRLVDAVAFHAEHGEVCPAGWQQGQDGFAATGAGVAGYLATRATSL